MLMLSVFLCIGSLIAARALITLGWTNWTNSIDFGPYEGTPLTYISIPKIYEGTCKEGITSSGTLESPSRKLNTDEIKAAVKLHRDVYVGAHRSGTDSTDSKKARANFSCAILIGVHWRGLGGSLPFAAFDLADLTHNVFGKIWAWDKDPSDVDFEGASFFGASLEQANFEGVNLRGANLFPAI